MAAFENQDPIKPSEITPFEIASSRRSFLAQAVAGGTAGVLAFAGREAFAAPLAAKSNALYGAGEKATSFKDASSYNNFYEFGTSKSDPAAKASGFGGGPWKVKIEGLVDKPFELDIEELMKLAPIEERLYRMRCVEGWSMAIPWDGIPLSVLVDKARPKGAAKFVEFVSLADPARMPGLSGGSLDWPYREGLRIDEAMHPLALLAFGMHGQKLPGQNGAPARLVVPWKYGFKSAKSLVAIRFVERMPQTSWVRANASEYGFYSNVNPEVDHPRWSQASERRIGEDGLFSRKRKTLMFNGYPEVGSMYSGMDMKKFF